ncbi:MAG: hypothetical protein IJP23_05865 [Oscillospiraceae bacterium]|nr:hypothetical protein [Oscillospiraceae bacterium]
MGISVSGQSIQFLQSALMGLGLGLAYDLLGAVRYRFGRLSVTIALDILFSILFFLCLGWFAMGPGEGKLRLFALLGAFLGGTFYFLLLSRFFSRVFRFVTVWTVKLLSFLLLPLKGMVFLSKKVVKLQKNIFSFLKKYYKIIRKQRSSYGARKKRRRGRLKEGAHLETEKDRPGGKDSHPDNRPLRSGKPAEPSQPAGRLQKSAHGHSAPDRATASGKRRTSFRPGRIRR